MKDEFDFKAYDEDVAKCEAYVEAKLGKESRAALRMDRLLRMAGLRLKPYLFWNPFFLFLSITLVADFIFSLAILLFAEPIYSVERLLIGGAGFGLLPGLWMLFVYYRFRRKLEVTTWEEFKSRKGER